MKIIYIHSPKHGVKEVFVDDEDFDYLIQFKWHVHIKPGEKTFYAKRITRRDVDGYRTSFFMHREIMKINSPETRKIQVDHIDNNGLNCQKMNMRLVTNKQNSYNKGLRKKRSSDYIGVCWHKAGKGWTASIIINGSKKYLGLFPTPEDAARERDKAVIKYYGEHGKLNFKESDDRYTDNK